MSYSDRVRMDERAEHLQIVGKPVRKKDAMQLVTGQPVYTNDLAPADCLIVKLLRSPYANAIVEEIDISRAQKAEGIVAIYTWKDVDQNAKRYTQAGQTYPELSPYDRLLIDRHVRFVGDPVAIIAGETEKAVDMAMRRIKVKYQVLEPVLDFHTAKDHRVLVHPEENWEALIPSGGDNHRNLCSHEEDSHGDIDAVLADCDIVIDRTYRVPACQQAMMEPFRTYCSIDRYGRLEVVSSTQIVFHCRRIIANALHIPKSKVHVRNARLGGGFGAKQTAVSEVYPAFVTWMTKRPSKILFSRTECQIASSPRHEMEMHVRLGARKDGTVRGIDLYTLSNTGAYGEHGPTTAGLSGHKAIPLYGKAEAHRFTYDVVYTNHMSSGAYRGYGATQGLFAVESAVNELAVKLGMDPFEIRKKNIPHEGDELPAYDPGYHLTSSALDRCIDRVREMIGWEEKGPRRIMPDGKVRTIGMGLSMQGSGISAVDVGSASIKLNDEGFYILRLGSCDMGTGSETTMSQIVAEVLMCPLDNVQAVSADTDSSPYDSGSYASSTAYVTGKAVQQCAEKMMGQIKKLGAAILQKEPDQVSFDGARVFLPEGEEPSEGGQREVSLFDIATKSMFFNDIATEVTVTHSSPISPPPFMCGAAELETDLATGEMKVIHYAACVDCGTPLNRNIVRVQAEGGILQGIGMTLTEGVTYNAQGHLAENSFLQYKIPSRLDIGHIDVAVEGSYEESGPFGAKSIGEVVINTPAPAIQEAIYQATGQRFCNLPITTEDVAMSQIKERTPEYSEAQTDSLI